MYFVPKILYSLVSWPYKKNTRQIKCSICKRNVKIKKENMHTSKKVKIKVFYFFFDFGIKDVKGIMP